MILAYSIMKMDKKFAVGTTILIALIFLAYGVANVKQNNFAPQNQLEPDLSTNDQTPLIYVYNPLITLEETSEPKKSKSPYIWVNSGATILIDKTIAKTIQGSLPPFSQWRRTYNNQNPIDTDNGYHPQNIFRLITRKAWQNSTQEAYIKINKDNLSQSPNRNESNGLFLLNRYLNGNNTYYAGIRVDGFAIIKKKYGGTYYTLASTQVWPGNYHRVYSPSLLPKNQWIGLKTEVFNQNNAVVIKFYVDREGRSQWTEVLTVHDNGINNIPALFSAGYSGIRSDFMDIEIKNYILSGKN